MSQQPPQTQQQQQQQQQQPEQNEGSTVYSPWVLFIYDIIVLRFSNYFVWKCPTGSVQLPLFRSALGGRHLDIGVGSGYYPAAAVPGSACRELTLVDLNPEVLEHASARVKKAAAGRSPVHVRTVAADAREEIPLPAGQDKFDSISAFYLLHCVPGTAESKSVIFRVLARRLSPDGVLVGSTILGREMPMNWIAKGLMTAYNRKGIFCNWDDDRATYEAGLRRYFDTVDVSVVGRVMLFTARKPKV